MPTARASALPIFRQEVDTGPSAVHHAPLMALTVVVREGSSNGTFVGPVRLSPQAPRVVRSGDLIRVGRIWLELTTAQVLPTQNQSLVTKEIALALVASSLAADGAPSAPRLFVTAGPDVGKELLLSEFDHVYC